MHTPTATDSRRRASCIRVVSAAVRSSVNSYFASRGIFVLSGASSIKHSSCEWALLEGFKGHGGQKSKPHRNVFPRLHLVVNNNIILDVRVTQENCIARSTS